MKPPWSKYCLLLGVLLGAPGSALGGDADGGTRSVFASGEGNRALAMGGAFVAIADDASAALWNAGGLGLVPRREFQASRTNLFDLDMTEDYAAVVLPSWRFGAVSLIFRRLGASGIDGRDANNVRTGEELSWGESEIGLAYGRQLTEGLSAGAAFKFRQQSLASLNARGFGADLGFHARPGLLLGSHGTWADQLTMGLSLRNLVAPSLRLDEAAVSDPMTLALGGAYALPVRLGGSLLASFDVEQSRDLQSRFHAGLEYRPHALLALRAGFSDATPTVGAGIEWHGLALDYLYEDNPLGTVSRVGLSLGFGATVEESRLTATRAEEQTLQKQLTDAMDLRQQSRAAELLTDAENAMRDGHHDDALQRVALVSALFPNDERAIEIEARCWREKAAAQEEAEAYAEAALAFARALSVAPGDSTAARGVARCRAESDRRATRSEQIRRQFAEALDSFGAGDLPAARRGFAAILQSKPQDQEAAAMLARTEASIRQRIDDLSDQVRRFTQAGLFAEAAAEIARLRQLAPASPELVNLEYALTRSRGKVAGSARNALDGTTLSEVASVPEAGSSPPLSPQQRHEIEDLYKRGVEAMQAGRGSDAVRYWELVHSADPEYQQVREYLKREYLMGGMDSFADGKLDLAVNYWEKALRLDPTDEKTRGYLARAQQQLTRTREILGSR